jgi:hypothetical protein
MIQTVCVTNNYSSDNNGISSVVEDTVLSPLVFNTGQTELTPKWVESLAGLLDKATRDLRPNQLPTVLPVDVAVRLLEAVTLVLKQEATLVEVRLPSLYQRRGA